MMMMTISMPQTNWFAKTASTLAIATMAFNSNIPNAMAKSAKVTVDAFVPKTEQLIAQADAAVAKAVCVRSDNFLAGDAKSFIVVGNATETNKNIETLAEACKKTLQEDKKAGAGNGGGWLAYTKEAIGAYFEPTKLNTLKTFSAVGLGVTGAVATQTIPAQVTKPTNTETAPSSKPKTTSPPLKPVEVLKPTAATTTTSNKPKPSNAKTKATPSNTPKPTVKTKPSNKPVPATKDSSSFKRLDLDDETTKAFTNATFKGVKVRVPTNPKQAIAFCAQPSDFVENAFAITDAYTIPQELAGASSKKLLGESKVKEAINKAYLDCTAKDQAIFGTTMAPVTATNAKGEKIKGFALPRILPSTQTALEKFDNKFNINLNKVNIPSGNED